MGSAVVALAVLIKSPAALALLFIGVIVVRRGEGSPAQRLPKALLGPGLVAAAVAVAATLLGGTGSGWLRTQSVAGTIHTPLSLSSDLGQGLGALAHALTGAELLTVKEAVQSLGLAVAVAAIAFFALGALRGRLHPVRGLGLSLLVLVALSPMVQPWYLLWGTAVVAATVSAWDDRIVPVLMVLSAALVYETAPSGHTPLYGFVLAAVACATAVVVVRRGPLTEPGGPGSGGPPGPPGRPSAARPR